MILVWLIALPLLGGFAAWALARWNTTCARWASLIALAADGVLLAGLWQSWEPTGKWQADIALQWAPQLGIGFHLAMDGLGLILVALAVVLGIMAVACSWTEIQERVGFFHFNLMVVLSGIIGVFVAVDLFLFFFFWELMLVPMYFLIALWGHENRRYAAIKFFLFTQAGGLLMLVAILGIYFIHGRQTGDFTFDYFQLLGTHVGPAGVWLMLGFLAAFAVKLPVVPLHTWLPDAHTEAPTAGSVVLAGLLLKTGAYGVLRFAVPLFPEACAEAAPYAMGLGVVGIIYGAVLAFAQTDLKRLVAYTSVSHMGFVFLGCFSWNDLALNGVVMQIVCHGLSTGGLFILVGALQERAGTRDMNAMGGLWSSVPGMGAVGLILALASLGLPGLGNFVAEFLILLGIFQVSPIMAAPAAAGLVFAAIYALWMMLKVFYGSEERSWTMPDLNMREAVVFAVLILGLVWLGLKPQPVIDVSKPALSMTVIVRSDVVPVPGGRPTSSASDGKPDFAPEEDRPPHSVISRGDDVTQPVQSPLAASTATQPADGDR